MTMNTNKTVAELKAEADFHAKKAAEFAVMSNDEPAGAYKARLEAAYVMHAGIARRRSNEVRRILKTGGAPVLA